MSKSACLLVGSCLALQIPLALGAVTHVSSEAGRTELPLYTQAHARELLDPSETTTLASNAEAKPQDVAKFIFKKTRELLPVPFRGRSRQVAQALIENANKHHMDPLFLMAVINTESKFNPLALGRHGEIGLMQIKPTTAQWVLKKQGTEIEDLAWVATSLKDPVANIRYGAAYLASLRTSFKGRSHLYISAYNMGAANVRGHLKTGVSPRIYSTKVLAGYVAFSGGVSGRPVTATVSASVAPEMPLAPIAQPRRIAAVRGVRDIASRTLGL